MHYSLCPALPFSNNYFSCAPPYLVGVFLFSHIAGILFPKLGRLPAFGAGFRKGGAGVAEKGYDHDGGQGQNINRRGHGEAAPGRIQRRLGRRDAPAAPNPEKLDDLSALLEAGEEPATGGTPTLAALLEAEGAERPAVPAVDDWPGGEADVKAKTKVNKDSARHNEAEKGGEKAKKKKGWLRRRLTPKRVVLGLAALFVFGLLFAGFFFVYSTRNDNLWLDLETIPFRTETILYYTDPVTGETDTFAVIPCTQSKEYVDGAQIPDTLRHAFVAIEDRKFYTHHGVDIPRTAFAVVNEVWYRLTGSYIGGNEGRRQGASTITQQLIKNLTRDDDDSDMAGYMRKLRELCRGLRLDALYTKDEILNAYLNTISFTGNTAGVQAESRKLFGKTVDALSLPECASLAAITNNPSRYSPVKNPEAHLERRNFVLQRMLEEEFISQGEYEAAVAEPLTLNYQGEAPLPKYVTSYFTDRVIEEVITEFAEQYNLSRAEGSNLFYNGGLRIYTTVNPTLQRAMEEVMVSASYHPRPAATATKPLSDEEGQPLLDENGEQLYGPVEVLPQAAMISLDYEGGVAALVGGLGEKTVSRGFNRATSALRQVGSTMKPISPYVTAMEDGWITWSSAFPDEPVLVIKNEATGEESDWPANYSGAYSGRDILVREGIANSLNTTAARVGRQAGNRRMYTFLRGDLGIGSLVRADAAPGPLTLGSTTYGISPMNMAKAYAMFGNGGVTVTPHCFTVIKNGLGGQMLKVSIPAKRVISEDTAFIMNKLLGEVMVNGTAAGMGLGGGMPSAGKTGTTNDNRDHWFVGLTPYYVTASWYGYDENIPLDVNRQAHPPTLAWRAAMAAGQAGLPVMDFPECAGVQQCEYCVESGAAAGPNCPSATGWYKWWQPPAHGCPIHGG